MRRHLKQQQIYFNTSHVTVYRPGIRKAVRCSKISIHLMLLFIVIPLRIVIIIPDFNTSHVTVYRNTKAKLRQQSEFQYISCYCLSDGTNGKMYFVSEFQYISCYCLSWCNVIYLVACKDFNTSHVTVYRFDACSCTPAISYFNTSHVTVYLEKLATDTTVTLFQYISCYCLSHCRPG